MFIYERGWVCCRSSNCAAAGEAASGGGGGGGIKFIDKKNIFEWNEIYA